MSSFLSSAYGSAKEFLTSSQEVTSSYMAMFAFGIIMLIAWFFFYFSFRNQSKFLRKSFSVSQSYLLICFASFGLFLICQGVVAFPGAVNETAEMEADYGFGNAFGSILVLFSVQYLFSRSKHLMSDDLRSVHYGIHALFALLLVVFNIIRGIQLSAVLKLTSVDALNAMTQVWLNADYIGSALFIIFFILATISLFIFIKNRSNETESISKLSWGAIASYFWLYLSLILIYSYSASGSKIALSASAYFFYAVFLVFLGLNDMTYKNAATLEAKLGGTRI